MFNLADSAIMVGLTILLWTLAMEGRRIEAREKKEAQRAVALGGTGGEGGVESGLEEYPSDYKVEEYKAIEVSPPQGGQEPWDR